MKSEIITIAGKLGSGKSSTAKMLSKRLDYEHFSSGDLFRAIAAEHSRGLLEANFAAEKDATIDHLVDQRLREIGENETRKVIDSRTAWHWMPNSFKVYLELPTQIAAQRIIDQMHERRDANEEVPEDIDEYARQLDARLDSENKRYKQLYDIDPSIMQNYDIVIDTSQHTIEDVVERILEHYEMWRNS